MKNKLIILIFLLASLVFLSSTEKNSKKKTEPQGVVEKMAPEIAAIKATGNLDKQVALYKKLIKRVSAENAQEELLQSGLSFDGQTHLLNHTVGDFLYDKYGSSGLLYCKDYFLSSCYHGFVIRAVADRGLDVLKDVMNICWQKGEHVAVQCSHAIGHGFLAWVDYANLTKALTNCDQLGRSSERFPLYNCHDGVFMENIWAVHEDGKTSKDAWLNPNDSIYPCNDSRIDSRYINACWSNQPMRMYQMFKGDLAAVGRECLNLTNLTYQKTCFDGLARQIHPLTKGSAEETFKLCNLVPFPWIDSCIISIARAAFSVGDQKIPFELCFRIQEASKRRCYETLVDIIVPYTRRESLERKRLCRNILDEELQQRCTE